MIRLLFVSNLFPSVEAPRRGLDNAHLLHALAEFDDEFSIRVISPRPSLLPIHHHARPEDTDARFAPRFPRANYLPKVGSKTNAPLFRRAVLRGLKAALRDEPEFQPDVVLSSWLFPDGCAASSIANSLEIPHLMIAQGTDVNLYLTIPERRRLIVEATNQAHSVITRSSALAADLGKAGTDEAKLFPIYNGVNDRIFFPGRPSMDNPERPRRLLFVGNLLPVKDPLLLLESHALAVSQLASQASPPLELRLIGEGPMHDQIVAHAAELGTEDQVKLLGGLPPSEVGAQMREADLLVLSSVSEGLPNVVLEATAVGLPIVSVNVGGIAEFLQYGAPMTLTSERTAASIATAIVASLSDPPTPKATALNADLSWRSSADAYAARIRDAVKFS